MHLDFLLSFCGFCAVLYCRSLSSCGEWSGQDKILTNDRWQCRCWRFAAPNRLFRPAKRPVWPDEMASFAARSAAVGNWLWPRWLRGAAMPLNCFYKISFAHGGKCFPVRAAAWLPAALRLASPCGGRWRCGACRGEAFAPLKGQNIQKTLLIVQNTRKNNCQ